MKSSIFWDITPYSPMKVNWRFGGICRLHLQGRRISRARNQHEAGSSRTCFLLPLWILANFQFLNLYTVGRTLWTGDQPVARPLYLHTDKTHTHIHSSSGIRTHDLCVFERAKRVHALDCAATVIGPSIIIIIIMTLRPFVGPWPRRFQFLDPIHSR
jgi:hypothetical protein